jgi:hypothetical protein
VTPLAQEIAHAVWASTDMPMWQWNEEARKALDMRAHGPKDQSAVKSGVRAVLHALGKPVPEEYQ